jgi:hypothetical protein
MAVTIVTAKVIPANGDTPWPVRVFDFKKLKPTQYYFDHAEGCAGHDLTPDERLIVANAPLNIFIQTDGRWRVDGGPIREGKYARIIIWQDTSATSSETVAVARYDNGWIDRRIKP